MKKVLNIVIAGCMALFAASIANAQADQLQPAEARQNQPKRPNLMQLLDLSQDQVRQLRRINQANKQLREEAQMKLRKAQAALDQSIYNEQLDESDVQAKLKELQQADSEVKRLKAETELAIRKVLTPEQLAKFKELRQRIQAVRNRPVLMRPNQRPFKNNRPQ